jgi:hypothetical protein
MDSLRSRGQSRAAAMIKYQPAAQPICGLGDLEKMSRALRHLVCYANIVYNTYILGCDARAIGNLKPRSPPLHWVVFAKFKDSENFSNGPKACETPAGKTTLGHTRPRGSVGCFRPIAPSRPAKLSQRRMRRSVPCGSDLRWTARGGFVQQDFPLDMGFIARISVVA